MAVAFYHRFRQSCNFFPSFNGSVRLYVAFNHIPRNLLYNALNIMDWYNISHFNDKDPKHTFACKWAFFNTIYIKLSHSIHALTQTHRALRPFRALYTLFMATFERPYFHLLNLYLHHSSWSALGFDIKLSNHIWPVMRVCCHSLWACIVRALH